MSLFGNNASGGRGSSKNLVEFRAGKMTLKNTTVTADKRKGQLYIHQSDDGLIHLCWKDRKTQAVEDDLIIFPGDCEFKRVPECTTGRVYLLRFKNPSRKLFFWMQEPKSDKDDDICKKVNDSINNPPSQESEPSSLGARNFQELFSNMDQQQLLQMMSQSGVGGSNLNDWLGGMANRSQRSQPPSRTSTVSSSSRPRASATAAKPAGSTATDEKSDKPAAKPSDATGATSSAPNAAATAAPTSPGVQLSQLKNILSEMGVSKEPVDLSEAITADVMAPILTNPEVQERLKPFLPKDEVLPSTQEELKQTVHSPQFKQAMRSFSAALSSGQLGPVMKQFGLNDAAQTAANAGDVEAFAKAMQGSEESCNKDDQGDEKME